MSQVTALHTKCRSGDLALSYNTGSNETVQRLPVKDEDVPWDAAMTLYTPTTFTADIVKKNVGVWADGDIIQFNTVDGKVDRRSFEGLYQFDRKGWPQNPHGRTGLAGRGLLGRWGPNHAADPVVTRWKRDAKTNEIMKNSSDGLPILQFVSIKRRDTGEWAIPGGMVDTGEEVSITLKREFSEEALSSLQLSAEELKAVSENISDFFDRGIDIYKGYVDDPRNTDNAWMETVAVNFHDEKGDTVAKFPLHAGDDAVGVKWVDVDSNLQLYASHKHFIEIVAKNHNAHW